MTTGRTAARPLLSAAACVALMASGCGQVAPGEQSAGPSSAATSSNADPTASTDTRTHTVPPAPTPGPRATPGCDDLTEPVYRMVHGDQPDESLPAEVRELADEVEDNALATVTSRLSGLVVQPDFDPVAVETQWGQFRQLCDLD